METNLIYCGDNLEVLAKFPEKSVDLIYADPPFFSNKHYEILWGNGAEMKVYEDRWKGGINVYIEWMKERLWQCYRVLKDTGSMYLHCDWHATHRLRVAMDELFGDKKFRNEIIWRIGWVSGYKTQKRGWVRNHDTILYYVKSDRRRDGSLPKGQGIPMEDTWNCHEADRLDSIMIMSFSREKLGYPTQKPEALLKRIIEASSNRDDIVLDPFCGCGTAPVVAHQLSRKWIGVDVSPIACSLMKDRLNKVGANDVRIMGAPATIKELKSLEPFQFQNWVIDRIGGVPSSKKVDDKGVDGYTFMAREPVQVKQSEGVGRNVVDNFETAIRRKHKTTGYIIAFSFAKGAHEEAARAKLEDKLDIKLVRVDEMDNYF